MDIEDVKRLVIQPGEILVCHVRQQSTTEDMQSAKERLQAVLKEACGFDVPVIMVRGDVEFTVVRDERNGGEASHADQADRWPVG
jgi:hypothetical protein